jgi:hypothetical protein
MMDAIIRVSACARSTGGDYTHTDRTAVDLSMFYRYAMGNLVCCMRAVPPRVIIRSNIYLALIFLFTVYNLVKLACSKIWGVIT